jgi:hypothetical protein
VLADRALPFRAACTASNGVRDPSWTAARDRASRGNGVNELRTPSPGELSDLMVIALTGVLPLAMLDAPRSDGSWQMHRAGYVVPVKIRTYTRLLGYRTPR